MEEVLIKRKNLVCIIFLLKLTRFIILYCSIQLPFLPSQELLLAHPQHAGTSFSSLLTAADVLESFSSVEVSDKVYNISEDYDY